MQERNELDWKDVVDTYFEKCVAITLLFTVFVFIVFPSVETAVILSSEKVMDSIEIPPDIPEEIKPPETVIQPIVKIEIVDEPDEGEDLREITTIDENVVPEEVKIEIPPQEEHGKTDKFVFYEDAPVILPGAAQPVYPNHLRKMGVTGAVTLEIEILRDGSIGAIEVVKSLQGGFDEAAIEAVRQWKMQPAKNGGIPVACWIRQTFNFSVN